MSARNFQIHDAFTSRVVVDPTDAEKTWKILELAIHLIYIRNFTGLCFEELYRHARKFVVHKFGEKLYADRISALTVHLKQTVASIEAFQGPLFLEELNRKWMEHNKAFQMSCDILEYMDLTFIPSTRKTPVLELGLNLWRGLIIRSSKIQTRLKAALLEIVQKERNGEEINLALVKNLVKWLMDCGSSIYEEYFEKPFLDALADFYRCKSQEYIEWFEDCGEYLEFADECLKEETNRVSPYLDSKINVKITNVVEKEMIQKHMNQLVNREKSGLVDMILRNKYTDLSLMYRLYGRVTGGLSLILDVMISHILETGKQLFPEDPGHFVEHLLDKKDKYNEIIDKAFNNDKTLQKDLNSRLPESISLFVDDKLRKILNGVSDGDVEVLLDKVMMLFLHLLENNIFKKHMGKQFKATLLETVKEEREGKVINQSSMRNIVKKLMDVDPSICKEYFEKPFLEDLAIFYRRKSQDFIKPYDCGDYLKKVDKCLNEEIDRVSHYLYPEIEANITCVVMGEMIQTHMSQLVTMEKSTLVHMILNDKYEDLGLMYRLFRRVPNGLSLILHVMTLHILETGKQLVNDPEQVKHPVDFVQRLLDIKYKHDKIINQAFNNDKTFQDDLNLWFGRFINLNPRLPEFISLFVDDKLQKGLKGVSEEEVELLLDKVIMLFRYLPDEGQSEMCYKQHVGKRLKDTLLEIMQKERDGEVLNQALMRNIGEKLMDIDSSIYEEYFEKPFLDVSADFYLRESQEFIEGYDNCWDYLKEVDKRLNEKIDRASHYLGRNIKAKITDVVKKVMIETHMNQLVNMQNSSFVRMILNDKYEDLSRMYQSFCDVSNGISFICEVMKSHIRETGKQLVTDPERLKEPVDFVQRLLDKKDKLDKIINQAFNNDKAFQNALKLSFEYFINFDPRLPKFISLFVDDKFRKGLKGVNEEDVEALLDKVMMLFRCLPEKDVFERYYRDHLAKRLLSKGIINEDKAERSLILKLKTECGNQFTSKLEVMFTDKKTSQDTMLGFHEAMGPELADGPALTVHVLTTWAWLTQSTTSCNLPKEILTVCDQFRTYYIGTHNKRHLTWQTNMGSADIKATFTGVQKHELNVSTYQMCVLMLFNDTDRLSYKEIEQATEIPGTELKQSLLPLVCVKETNVLRKEPMSKEIGEEDEFVFNDEFRSKFYKVKIEAVVGQQESELEEPETQKRSEEARKLQIDAAIVRIMKARRVLDHNTIVAEVKLQSRFLPNPGVIKKRIEALIERDFLERDPVNQALYRYLD